MSQLRRYAAAGDLQLRTWAANTADANPMHLRIVFQKPDDLVTWLEAGATVPNGVAFDRFGSDKPAQLNRQEDVTSTIAYRKYLREFDYSVSLWGDCYHAVSSIADRLPEIDFYDDTVWSPVLSSAEEILAFFAHQGAAYGSAHAEEELQARNLFQYDLWGDGRMSTSMLGMDIYRYVPSLYWLNYFSNEYLELHGLDLDSIVSRAGGTITHLKRGMILRLYDHYSDWTRREQFVLPIIEQDTSFFAMSRVETPQNLNPREFAGFLAEIGKQWP